MLLALQSSDDVIAREPKSLRGWLLPGSVALHIVAVVALPSGARRAAVVPPPVVFEMSEPPPPAPAPPASPPPRDAPPVAPAHALPERVAARRAAPENAPAKTPQEEAPVDFTSTTFSSEGPGMAVGAQPVGPPAKAPLAPAAAPVRVIATAPSVPASALGKPPRAPGLDAELERNYPADARRSGISGTATLQVELLPDGRVGKVVPLSESYPGFGRACDRTVRAGKWEPPIDREGRPVRTEIKYVCKFEVRS